MITVTNVTKVYGKDKTRVVALRDVHLKVKDGEFVAISGPSGSGKSTLLNVIGGLLTPTTGEVVVDNTSIYDLNSDERARFRKKTIGFVFQKFNLIPYLTAIENVQVPLYLAGMPPKTQQQIALRMLEKVGLQDRLTHLPDQLSVGEQQRVAIARALANDPSVILADELTGNLDRETGRSLLEHLKVLNEDEKVSVIMVTHDPDIARFAKRVLNIIDGQVQGDMRLE